MRKDGSHREKMLKLERSVFFHMRLSKMRKDASLLRNRVLKMKFVELDVGFPVVVSKMLSFREIAKKL